MSEPEVALVFSPERWVEDLHRHCVDHGGARIRCVVMDPALVLDEEYGVLVVSHRWPGLTVGFVEAVHARGRRCPRRPRSVRADGVAPPRAGAGRRRRPRRRVDGRVRHRDRRPCARRRSGESSSGSCPRRHRCPAPRRSVRRRSPHRRRWPGGRGAHGARDRADPSPGYGGRARRVGRRRRGCAGGGRAAGSAHRAEPPYRGRRGRVRPRIVGRHPLHTRAWRARGTGRVAERRVVVTVAAGRGARRRPRVARAAPTGRRRRRPDVGGRLDGRAGQVRDHPRARRGCRRPDRRRRGDTRRRDPTPRVVRRRPRAQPISADTPRHFARAD